MYSLIHRLGYEEFSRHQVPALASSLLIAEFLYKFHSFWLECLAFLATWYVLEAAISRLIDPMNAYHRRKLAETILGSLALRSIPYRESIQEVELSEGGDS